MKLSCWGGVIPDRLHSLGLVTAGLALLIAITPPLRAESLENLIATYRKKPSPSTRAAVLRFAAAHPKDRDGGLALLALGQVEVEQNQYADAVKHVQSVEGRVSALADYAQYLQAVALYGLKRPSEALPLLESVWRSAVQSPLNGKAALLASKCLLDLHEAARALAVIEAHRGAMSDTTAELARAQAMEAAGRPVDAAAGYQRIWSEFPNSAEASTAESALARLRNRPGYPKETSVMLLLRGRKFLEAHEFVRAAAHLQSALPRLDRDGQDTARVMLAGIRYFRRDAGALSALHALQVTAPEADAERLYYIVLAANRTSRPGDAHDALSRLEQYHGKSKWFLQALVAGANRFAMDRVPAAAQPLLRSCFDSFPDDPEAPGCHWKYVWQNYIETRAAGRDGLLDHLRRYPNSEKASAALYYLGRIAQNSHDYPGARAYYEQITAFFPNQYYTTLAYERIRENGVSGAKPSPAVVAQLAALHLPDRRARPDLIANAAMQVRLDRSQLLAQAGLYDLAEDELKFAARGNAQQPQVIALALAELAGREQTPERGIRFIKHYAPEYLNLPFNSATDRLWRLAFPIPFRELLEQSARTSAVDPFIVAALIRQESEFNPRAVSHSKAYGLTQILPGTGRQLSRRMSLKGFRTAMLFTPEINLRLGTFYLRMLLDQLQGHWEETLASYNAGKGRVDQWLANTQFTEPAEFVENIPIAETRNYVQTVIRNADVYRRLYGH